MSDRRRLQVVRGEQPPATDAGIGSRLLCEAASLAGGYVAARLATVPPDDPCRAQLEAIAYRHLAPGDSAIPVEAG